VNTATADPLVGRVLEGRYRLKAQIARGGMSTVYAAVDERLDRLVAVKVMSPALSADPAFSDRFTREARAAARLTHLNAVAVYDQGYDRGDSGPLVFLVMELVTGRTLRDLLRERGRLSPAEAVSIMEPVLAALCAAHRAGLVHRDVKPENILLSDEGVLKVADFGLARAVEADASSTRTGLMMGTVAYCSPEQIARGRSDQRSDVYSAGVVLFELLTGRPPYVGDSAVNVAYQHVHGHVPAPSTLAPGIAAELDDLVLRVTDSEPAGRPLDAGAFLAELADVRADLGLPVVPVPPRARPATERGIYADATAGSATEAVRHRAGDTSVTNPLHGDAGTHDTIAVGVGVGAGAGVSGAGVSGAGVSGAGERGGPPPPIVMPPPAPGDRQRSARSIRRRRGLIVLLIVLILGAAAGTGGWWLAAGRYSRVPAVAGASQAAAMQSLRSAGYQVAPQAESQFSETVPPNLVITTEPAAGARIVRGRLITLIVSRGKDRVTIPMVAGKSPADAAALLQTTLKNVVLINQANDTVQSGLVIGTLPAAGTPVKPDAQVQLLVSTGPPLVSVPDETGQPQNAAADALTNAGFKVTVTQDFSNSVPSGSVINQSPAGGNNATAVKFSPVTIDVSKGPQTVVIPSIPELTALDTAQRTLGQLGLKVKVQRSFGGHAGLVVGMDPAAGTTVDVGSIVTLTVV
jgi:beta-lactam-binding protein with PASTA domain